MDLQHDNVGGIGVTEAWTTISNVGASIRNKAKAKAAQKVADAGNYWTLRPFLKSLIPVPQYIINEVAGQGITKQAVLDLPAQTIGGTNANVIAQLKTLSGGGSLNTAVIGEGGVIETATPAAAPKELVTSGVTKYVPYIIGAVVIGLIIYLIAKKR